MTTQQTTTMTMPIDDILRYADEPVASDKELTELYEENRRLVALRMKATKAEFDKNETMLSTSDKKGLKDLNASLTTKPATKSFGLDRSTVIIIVSLVVGAIVGVIVGQMWNEYAAPHVPGESLDSGAVLVLFALCTAAGCFFGSLLNDRRNK